MSLLSILGAASTPPNEVTVVVLICLLPVMLVMSGFFSGSETALFCLNASHRQKMRQSTHAGSRSALTLLSEPRMLLITLLLGNMTANVLYFVISSSLMMWASTNWFVQLALGIGSLLVIVLIGEIGPKMIASSKPARFSAFVAPILLVIHRAIGPIRVVVDAAIVTPISRLSGSGQRNDSLSADELERLLVHSSNSGVVNREEHQTLLDVIKLGNMTIRKAMTPRTKTVTIQIDDEPEQIRTLIEKHRVSRLPVHGEDLDDILGVLPVKSWLKRNEQQQVSDLMVPARFIPEVTSLELGLDIFRKDGLVFAVVVDEYGGTSGVITLQDIVEELIGDIAEPTLEVSNPPRPLGPGRWVIDGDTSIRQFRDSLGSLANQTHAATIGGLITASLDRLPRTGDRVQIENLELEVHHADQGHVTSVIVSLNSGGSD